MKIVVFGSFSDSSGCGCIEEVELVEDEKVLEKVLEFKCRMSGEDEEEEEEEWWDKKEEQIEGVEEWIFDGGEVQGHIYIKEV